MFRRSLILAIALLGVLAAVSYGAEEIKIGLVAPITGEAATFGTSVRDAALLWQRQVNARGGIKGRQVRFYIEDDKNVPSEAANAVQKLINQTGVLMILGPVTTQPTLASVAIAQSNRVPLLTPTATNETITQAGDFIFRTCFIDPLQGQVMGKFAAENLNAKTAAMLYNVADDYSTGLAVSFREHFEARGGRIVATETFSTGDSDFSAQLTKIKRADPDVIWLPYYYNTVGLITRQARQLGISKAIFLGVDGWDSAELLPLAGDSIEGGYFSNHYSAETTEPVAVEFIKEYRAAYGSTPDALAALAYDACLVIEDALNRVANLDRESVRNALAATKDVPAVCGTLTLDENRNPIKDAVVLQVKDGQFKYIMNVKP